MIDKKLILYPKKLKEVIGYKEIKENLEPCGVVVIDARKQKFLHCIPAMIDTTNGNVYLSEAGFNSSWKLWKKSVRKGIQIAKENAGSSVKNPEDILVFDNLQRSGSTPVLVDDVIKYKAKELTEEERYRNSKRQSLLDNPQMLYFYDSTGQYFHDKDCPAVKEIALERFEASGELPEKEICPKCQRRIYIRKACYPNTKQIGICDKILRDHGVSLGKIKHCVMDVGMKFHAVSMEELLIEGTEDTWIVKGLNNKKLALWHNNYVRTGPMERYITDGFHKQKVENKSLSQLLSYVENYSFAKHLENEQQAADVEETMIHTIDEQETNLQNNAYEHRSILEVLRGMICRIRKIFKI